MCSAPSRPVPPAQTHLHSLRERASLAALRVLTLLPPLAARAQRRIGLLHARAGRGAEAITSFEAALARGLTPRADHYHQLGIALLDLGQPETATAHFHRAIELNPRAFWSHQGLGQALVLRGRIAEAEAAFRQGLSISQGHLWLTHHLIMLLFAEQRFGECLDMMIEVGMHEATGSLPKMPLVAFQFAGLATPARVSAFHDLVVRYPLDANLRVLFSHLLLEGGDQVVATAQLEQYRMRKWAQDPRTHNLAPDPTQPQPRFLIIGQGKAGTTSLYAYLCQHPRILPAIAKEVHYWSKHLAAEAGWYRANFPPIPPASGLITGEASPSYVGDVQVPACIASHLPDVKLILLLREPVSRAYSLYGMLRRQGRERRRWEEIVEQELAQMRACPMHLEDVPETPSDTWIPQSYLLGGAVLPYLQRWLAHFPPEQFLILHDEDLRRDTAGTVRRVYRFLDLPVFVPDCAEHHNVGRYEPMSPEIRQRLEDWFAPHQRLLEVLLADLGVAPPGVGG